MKETLTSPGAWQQAPPIDFAQVPSACFVLEARLLRRNLEILADVQRAADVTILLALKGFAMFSTFGLVRQYLGGTTASGLYEARLGYEEFGRRGHCYSPAYYAEEMPDLLRYCSHLSFNTPAQWARFRDAVATSDVRAGLRLNPEYAEVTTDLYNPCVPGSRLGSTAALLGDRLPDGVDGLHFHTLCESDSHALERTLRAVEDRFGRLLEQARWLNLGGGHLITRADYDRAHLVGLLRDLRARYGLELFLEPGSAVAWQTGYLTATVQDVFDSRGVRAVVLDVSVAAHMPDCLEMPYRPRVFRPDGEEGREPAYHRGEPDRGGPPVHRLGGTTCLAGDFVGDYVFDEPLRPGDRLIFDDMMHYTMVKTTFFNGVRHPSLGVWHEEGRFELLKTFGYEDYRHKLS